MNYFLQSSRQKRKVLIVDDELINRELLEAILSMNYEVFSAASGVEAMDMLRSSKEPYSLILLDLLMPQMSGFQVIEACKADEKLREIPIIVMTSEKSAETRSIRMGADDFIPKPYRMPEVILARCERIVELSEEKSLIRSIEKDKVTGLYIKVFFDAYTRRLLPGLRSEMDAVVLTLDGLSENSVQAEPVLKEAAQLFTDVVLGSKGIAGRVDDNVFYAFCEHKEGYEELVGNMYNKLTANSTKNDIRLRVGICDSVDKTASIESWFDSAKEACEGAGDSNEHYTVSYSV